MRKTYVTDIEFRVVPTRFCFDYKIHFDTWDEQELSELWWDFCVENKIIRTTKYTKEKEDYGNNFEY